MSTRSSLPAYFCWVLFALYCLQSILCPLPLSSYDSEQLLRLLHPGTPHSAYLSLLKTLLSGFRHEWWLYVIHTLNTLLFLAALALYQHSYSRHLTTHSKRLFFFCLPIGLLLLLQQLGPASLTLFLSCALCYYQSQWQTGKNKENLLLTVLLLYLLYLNDSSLFVGSMLLISINLWQQEQYAHTKILPWLSIIALTLSLYLVYPEYISHISTIPLFKTLALLSWRSFPLWLFLINALRSRHPEDRKKLFLAFIALIYFVLTYTPEHMDRISWLWPYLCLASEAGYTMKSHSLRSFLSFFASMAALLSILIAWLYWSSLVLHHPLFHSLLMKHLSLDSNTPITIPITLGLSFTLLWAISLYTSWQAQSTLYISGSCIFGAGMVILSLALPYLHKLNNYPLLAKTLYTELQQSTTSCLKTYSVPISLQAPLEFFSPLKLSTDSHCLSLVKLMSRLSQEGSSKMYLLRHLVHRHHLRQSLHLH